MTLLVDTQHRLTARLADGRPVQHEQSPNLTPNVTIQPRFVVFHYTACSHAAARNAFLRASTQVSAHLLIDTDGGVTQFAPFDRRAWHAGRSFWNGVNDLNSCAIGIEVVNLGYLGKRADGSFVASDGRTVVPASDVVEARHKHPGVSCPYWQAYTPAQIATCEQLVDVLVPHYRVEGVLGHDDIAPGRKLDPGPAFPLQRLAARAGGRDATGQEPLAVAVDRLRLRAGPGADFGQLGAGLVRDTIVQPLESRPDGWMRVRAHAEAPNLGWVMAQYLRDT